MNREKIIQQVLNAVRTNNIQEGKAVIDPQVILRMDNYQSCGVERWARWVQYLHLKGIQVVSFRFDQFIHTGPNSIQVTGFLTTKTASGQQRSNDVKLEFTFQGDKIIKIQSRRKNYTAILGDMFAWKPWALWHSLLLWFHVLRGDIK